MKSPALGHMGRMQMEPGLPVLCAPALLNYIPSVLVDVERMVPTPAMQLVPVSLLLEIKICIISAHSLFWKSDQTPEPAGCRIGSDSYDIHLGLSQGKANQGHQSLMSPTTR